MKSIRVHAHGGPDVLTLEEIDAPAPKAREVLVRHAFSGVNFIDTYHREGLYKVPLPSGLGQEGAGIVEAVGEGVTRFAIGDRIAYASGPTGSYGEANVVHEDKAVRVPDDVELDIAAAALLKGMTARYLLRKTFRVERGHDVLIYAAAGGVGQIAVQWAKHLGARVIAVVGGDEKAEIATRLGADVAIVSERENIAARVRESTNGEGVDVAYDSIGKDTFEMTLDCLKPLGLFVSFGNASGPAPPFAPLVLMQKGSLFFTRPTLGHYTRTPALLDETAGELFEVVANGAVKIAPPTRYKLADAAQAHRDLEARKTTGSLVLAL